MNHTANEIIEHLCEEFRQLDLPYGSKAYSNAQDYLRKHQCNGFCGEYECKENQANCKRLKKASEK